MENFRYLEQYTPMDKQKSIFYALEVGAEAENLFSDNYYTACAWACRKFLELFLKAVSQNEDEDEDEGTSKGLAKLIILFEDDLSFDPRIIREFNNMRLIGNKAVHERSCSRSEALDLLIWAYRTANICMEHYFKPKNFIEREFIIPENRNKDTELKEQREFYQQKIAFEKQQYDKILEKEKEERRLEAEALKEELKKEGKDKGFLEIALKNSKEIAKDLTKKGNQKKLLLEKNIALFKKTRYIFLGLCGFSVVWFFIMVNGLLEISFPFLLIGVIIYIIGIELFSKRIKANSDFLKSLEGKTAQNFEPKPSLIKKIFTFAKK